MITMIAAASLNGVIGQNNKLPFSYPEDLAHFKKTTLNSTVIMGRKTFESIGKPLPKRENLIVSSTGEFKNLKLALEKCNYNGFIIGGYSLYKEGMSYANKILLTVTPDIISGDDIVEFPWINPLIFNIESITNFENSKLKLITYNRI